VMTNKFDIDSEVDYRDTSTYLASELVFSKVPLQVQALTSKYNQYFGHYVINLFDCFDDPCYSRYILSLPSGGPDYEHLLR